MKIAVITPTYQTPQAFLQKCLESIATQTHKCTHFVINDGDSALDPKQFMDIELLQLPGPHNDVGNAARAIGSEVAIAQGFDAIAYLDADNWYDVDHLERMVKLHEESRAAVCTGSRRLFDLNGQLLGKCPEVDGERFVDTSCLFLGREAFQIACMWPLIPPELAAVGDRVIWQQITEKRLRRAHSSFPSVNYRTRYRGHYDLFGKTPPPNSKHIHITAGSNGKVRSAQTVFTADAAPSGPLFAQNSRASVTLCMIVRNEADNLPACLNQVHNLFSQIVVVDTGSCDNTKEIARQYGAEVFDFHWIDSFAAARNESLRHARREWIFWLDADDRFEPPNMQKLAALLKDLPSENRAYLMRQQSISADSTKAAFVVDQVRLFRNLPELRWRYRVHEQIQPNLHERGAKLVSSDIIISHLGYNDPALRQKKHARNVRLLEMDLHENPNDSFVLFNLGSVSADDGQWESAIRRLEQCLVHAPMRASFLPKLHVLLARGHFEIGQIDKALRYCTLGKDGFAEHPEVWFEEGMIHLARRDWPKAKECFERIADDCPRQSYFGMASDLTTSLARHNLALANRNSGHLNEAIKQWRNVIEKFPEFAPAWMGLLELYLNQNQTQEVGRLLAKVQYHRSDEALLVALQARIAIAEKDFVGARTQLEQGVARWPRHVWLRLVLADVLLHFSSDGNAAKLHLQTVLNDEPSNLQARQKLAEVLRRTSAAK